VRVLVPVWFRAERGGLHMHVRAQAAALRSAGHECVVQCPPGWLADSLKADGFDVVEHDFRDRISGVVSGLGAGPYDLVHAHPFAAREVGLQVADVLDIPFVLTIHGSYLDDLPRYAARVTRVVAVSKAAMEMLCRTVPELQPKVCLVPNGVNLDLFRPPSTPIDRPTRKHGTPRVLVVGRLDSDRRRVSAEVVTTWQQQRVGRPAWQWLVAGDGDSRLDLQRTVGDEVAFLGWQSQEELARLHTSVDVVVASGRSALEALAGAAAVVASGSRCHVGLIDERRVGYAIEVNFGDSGPLGR
jgi:glycosyltransferase involved in cell wall biosynthesis